MLIFSVGAPAEESLAVEAVGVALECAEVWVLDPDTVDETDEEDEMDAVDDTEEEDEAVEDVDVGEDVEPADVVEDADEMDEVDEEDEVDEVDEVDEKVRAGPAVEVNWKPSPFLPLPASSG